MRHTQLGNNLDVGVLGLGLMGMSAFYTGAGEDDASSIRTIHHAMDRGVTLYDTAEMYGPYLNEELLGRAIASQHRSNLVIGTKFGTIRHRDNGRRGLDGSPENIRISLEGSLKRLGTDYVDLYYQHRTDPKTPIEETVGAIADLIAEGKIRNYGLSEPSVETIRRAHAVYPMTAVQTEYSLWSRDLEADVLPALRELGIGLVAYSPLGRGFLTGTIRSPDGFAPADIRRVNPRFQGVNFETNLHLLKVLDVISADTGATPAQIALAWLLAQGPDIVPIPGTKHVERLNENINAETLILTKQQLIQLDSINSAAGDRYAGMKSINR
ncbi:aldo/keto reductase [Clavibacter michiganensis]|nr:aldo/keto reductase [Clavibacter michiganensis]